MSDITWRDQGDAEDFATECDAMGAEEAGRGDYKRGTMLLHAAACLRDQAEEIAALKAEVERLQGDGIHTCHDQCQRVACVLRRERDAMAAEVERLALLVRRGIELCERAKQIEGLHERQLRRAGTHGETVSGTILHQMDVALEASTDVWLDDARRALLEQKP